jgi:hypothetical protein
MSVNFFSWIRDGVRQSVLLGVSDAIEQLGTPAPAEELHPSVVGFLQRRSDAGPEDSPKFAVALDGTAGSVSRDGSAGSPQRVSRKRLGKSLKDISPLPNSASRTPPPRQE